MRKQLIAIMGLAAVLQQPASAQDENMRARITGGGGSDGRCTFEVEVDGEAEIEIRGDEGYLRTISGSPARWRRLECTQTLPRDPSDFEFKKTDGRGHQKLDRDPNSNGGVAVIRINDPKGGSERYQGEIKWHGGYGSSGSHGNKVNVDDLRGARASSGESEMQSRGFRNVDALTSGNTSYTIWWNRRTRQCIQVATADGRYDSLTDIGTHPKCHDRD